MNRVALGLAALAVTSVVAGCGSSSSGGSSPNTGPTSTVAASSSKVPGCDPSTMQTKTAGSLTFGVDKPAYAPFYIDNDPTNHKGFEDAVSYAIATELGFDNAHVQWARADFYQSIAPGSKPFDLYLDQYSINAAREKAVDFSTPYYDVSQVVVAMKNTPAAAVTTLAGLKAIKLGAQLGSTSATAITETVDPSQSPANYPKNPEAVQALKNGQIGGLVVDLPTAFYITSAQVPGSVIVGQLPATGGEHEQFGALMAKGTSLKPCIDKAITALTDDGTLKQIQDKWLAQVGKAPVLQ